MSRSRVIAAVLAVSFCVTSTWAGPCECPADADGSGAIDFQDILLVLADWGPCAGCPGDVDGNGVVDFQDLLDVLGAWGPCVFDYEPLRADAEAEQIGLEMIGAGGPLRVPDDVYDRVARDLGLIRTAEPTLAGETHSPAWVPEDLIVKKFPEVPPDDYDALNACLQLVLENHLFGDWYVLTFAGPLNAPALVEVYTALDSIEFAEPNGIFGGQNFWRPTDLGGGTWRWNVDDGYCDCFDGCDCHRLFVFEVDADGNVELLSFEEIFGLCCSGG